jgi:glycosyltransferase involved in cell wall biosynthesis
MVTSELPPTPGGVGQYVFCLSKKLIERGHQVTIITRKRSSDQMKQEIFEGIPVYRVPFYPLYPIHAFLLSIFINKLLRLIENSFDIVHLHSPMPLPIKTTLPVLSTIHTPMRIDARYHEIFSPKSLFEKIQSTTVYPPMESMLLKNSSMITAVSQKVALELKEYGITHSRITVIRNGVDIKSFFPDRQKDNTEDYVLYTGVLRARKGLFDFIQCAKYINKIRPNTKFLICGKGSFRTKLETLVRRMGLEQQILFLGYVDRKRLIRLYQNASVHVVPSHYEGMPTVLLEAMSCGLPVVATNIGGNNEVISSGINGLLVPPKSPKVMAEAILRLLDDVSLRKRIGAAARDTVVMNYTWDKVTDKIVECYENIMQSNSLT